jgi:hypothetical protein
VIQIQQSSVSCNQDQYAVLSSLRSITGPYLASLWKRLKASTCLTTHSSLLIWIATFQTSQTAHYPRSSPAHQYSNIAEKFHGPLHRKHHTYPINPHKHMRRLRSNSPEFISTLPSGAERILSPLSS